MNKQLLLSVALGGALTVVGAPTAEVVDGRYVFTVPEGETYTMTVEDVAAIGDRPFQKAGGGLLITGDEMGSHTGDVYIVDGLYKNTTKLSCGATNATAGAVYIDGGTLVNTIAGSSTGNDMSVTRHLHLKGEGYRGFGAISNIVYTANIGRNIYFDGDVKLCGTSTMNFRYDMVDMAGHTLTTDFPNGSGLMYVALTVQNPGSIDVRRGFCGFESQTVAGGTAAQTMTFAAGTVLRISVLLTPQGRSFIFNENTRVDNVSWDNLLYVPETGYHGTKNTGTLTGPATLNGTLTTSGTLGMGVNFTGPVSGPGGFDFSNGGWLRLTNPANTFAGGVAITGRTGADDLCVTGGLVLTANGALPTNGVSLKLKNANLNVYETDRCDLPALELDGKVVVTGHVGLVARDTPSLKKTGEGPLTVFGPLTVTGPVDIQSGTVRFGTRVPDREPGLYWGYDMNTDYSKTTDCTPAQLQGTSYYQGVDSTGASWAYKSWKSTVATTNASDGRVDWHYNYFYAGYMRVPGEEGTDVSCRFTSCIARNSQIVIDGTVVFQINDSKVIVPKDYVDPGANLNWQRHACPSNIVTLKAGWHRIYCYMGSHYQTGGPTSCTTDLYGRWPSNFGFGVNFNAHADDDFDTLTNVVNYVKLLDPGDGSFLCLDPDPTSKVTRASGKYRPVFAGPVAFASGTTLDIGDTRPYTPMAFPSLTGVPTLRNGRVEVGSSTWTLRAADVTGGAPLTIASSAELAFPAGDVTVDVSAEDLETLNAARRSAPFVLMTAEEGAALPANTFKVSDAVKAGRWRLVKDGSTLSFDSASGLSVILR